MSVMRWSSNGEGIYLLVNDGIDTGIVVNGTGVRVRKTVKGWEAEPITPRWKGFDLNKNLSLGQFHTFKTAKQAAEKHFRHTRKSTRVNPINQPKQNGAEKCGKLSRRIDFEYENLICLMSPPPMRCGQFPYRR